MIDHTFEFASWWSKEFPGTQCPPLPKNAEDLGLTARMNLRSNNPALYQNLFGGGGNGSAAMPADTVARRNSNQLQAGDVQHLRSAGLEWEAQELERRVQREMDQRMADQALSSRENYQQAMAKNRAWSEMGILERMGHQPLPPEVIAANRRRWGITGQ